MARLNNSLFGSLSGSLGELVCRHRNGKTYLSRKPEKVTLPDTPDHRRRVRKFGLCSSLSSALRKIKAFYESWEKLNPQSDNVKNNIFRICYALIKGEDDISGIVLVPVENPFPVSIIDVRLDSDRIIIRITQLSIPDRMGRRISVQGILQLQLPTDEYLKKNKFIPVYSKDYDFVSEVELIFEILLYSSDLEIIKDYSRRNLLINFAVKDAQGIPEMFSESCFTEL